jgi:hypothetical protein
MVMRNEVVIMIMESYDFCFGDFSDMISQQ